MPEITTFDEYLAATKTTAIYPGALTGNPQEISYLVHGLIGETAELLDVYDVKYHTHFETYTSNLIKELGDCFWYSFRLFEAIAAPIPDAVSVTHLVTDTPLLIMRNLANAARLAETAKKGIRDGLNIATPSTDIEQNKRRHFRECLERVQLGLYNVCINEKLYLFDVLSINAEKLSDRKARGVLKGNGDNR